MILDNKTLSDQILRCHNIEHYQILSVNKILVITIIIKIEIKRVILIGVKI